MRISDIKKIGYYIRRLIKGKYSLKTKIHIVLRYFEMGISIFFEKLRGLDYTMLYVTKMGGAYTKTPKYILKRVFNEFPEKNTKSFIDIGSGKGYVISQAAKAGFKSAGGIEYDSFLYNICLNNLKKEELKSDCVYNEDAGQSNHLGQFDIFFFNNPFGPEILKQVLENILESHKEKKCWIYWVNPNFGSCKMDVIENAGFVFVKNIEDKVEPYYTIAVFSNIENDRKK